MRPQIAAAPAARVFWGQPGLVREHLELELCGAAIVFTAGGKSGVGMALAETTSLRHEHFASPTGNHVFRALSELRALGIDVTRGDFDVDIANVVAERVKSRRRGYAMVRMCIEAFEQRDVGTTPEQIAGELVALVETS